MNNDSGTDMTNVCLQKMLIRTLNDNYKAYIF